MPLFYQETVVIADRWPLVRGSTKIFTVVIENFGGHARGPPKWPLLRVVTLRVGALSPVNIKSQRKTLKQYLGTVHNSHTA